MATASFTTPSSPLTMAALAAFIDAALGELRNAHRGASAPDSPIEGQRWWDTSGDPVDVLKRYTVAAGWITLLTVNKTTGAVTIQGLTLTAAATGFTIAGGTTSKTLTLDANVTASTLMLLTGANLAVGSDADGDMYYRASSVLARLAKGTANQKMFMNAGATAPEWANGIKICSSTFSTNNDTGDVAYTGAGFKPGLVHVICNVDATSLQCAGFYDGTTNRGLRDNTNSSAHTWTAAPTTMGELLTNGSSYFSVAGKSLDADGCTLTWTKAGTPTAGQTVQMTIIYFR